MLSGDDCKRKAFRRQRNSSFLRINSSHRESFGFQQELTVCFVGLGDEQNVLAQGRKAPGKRVVSRRSTGAFWNCNARARFCPPQITDITRVIFFRFAIQPGESGKNCVSPATHDTNTRKMGNFVTRSANMDGHEKADATCVRCSSGLNFLTRQSRTYLLPEYGLRSVG